MGMHADEKSHGCIVPVKPRTMPSDIGGEDGGGTAAGRGEGELRNACPGHSAGTGMSLLKCEQLPRVCAEVIGTTRRPARVDPDVAIGDPTQSL